MGPYTLKNSIGVKIFGAFLAMSLVIAGLGAYGYYVLAASGAIVADTYDHPMMAINFARAASVDFLEMQNDTLRAERASPGDRAKLLKRVDELAATLSADLAVAEERSTAPEERRVIDKIKTLVRDWHERRRAAIEKGRTPMLAGLDRQILDQFDLLIEFNADHGFISRREAVIQVGRFENMVIDVTAAALLFAICVTIFLVRRIVRPLSAAAHVAERIAAGKFETRIPSGGKDETGALLNSMQVMQDSIAAQMAREKARAQSAEVRVMDAVENSGQGVILADGQGKIAVANSELSRLFPALSDCFVPGTAISDVLQKIDAKCEAGDERPLVERLCSVERGAMPSADRQLPDGRWVRITSSATSEGGIIFFFGDFTDIKLREEHYRIAKQQAESANAAKSRFLANMSHELRTPLNAVIGFSEMLAGEVYGSLGDPRYGDYAGDILKSGRHLLDVINSVLDLARSETGHIELRKHLVDVLAIVGYCADALDQQCRDAGIALARPERSEPVFIEADEARLRQVFLNLLSNAVKFTAAGGIVGISVVEDAQDVKIEVRDSGIGMSPQDIETAMTPFAQVDNRLERRYEGAGLGVPLAKAFVESHGGTLSIESERGRGTIVRVRLPRTADAGLSAVA